MGQLALTGEKRKSKDPTVYVTGLHMEKEHQQRASKVWRI